MQENVSSRAVAWAFLVAPSSALAAAESIFQGLVLPIAAIGLLFWIAFATIAPFRRALLRLPRRLNRLGILALGTAVLSFAAVSILIGKTTIGSGVAVQAIEPMRFWLLIKLQVGVGCVLLVLGLLTKDRSK